MSSDESDLLKRGDVFRGYVVQKRLGAGGAASVYLAKHEMLDAQYALKILHPSVAVQDEHDFLRRFLREARLATRIRHPNLVVVHDCGYDEEWGVYYLVMDFVPGTSLRNILAFEGRLAPDRAASIVAQVASALEAAMPFQVVHRDIKPENIMVQPDGCVKLVDLGIAKAQNLGDSISTNTDSNFGTPSYISPEQAQCSARVDARADIYSLGIVFFEMLSGKCPYAGDNPADVLSQILSDDPVPDLRDFVRDVPVGLAVLVRRMTVKERDRRLGSFQAVLDELDKLGLGRLENIPFSPGYSSSSHEGMKTLLEGLGNDSKKAVDPLSEPDDDVRAFISRRTAGERKRRRLKTAIVAAAMILLLSIVSVVLLFLLVR